MLSFVVQAEPLRERDSLRARQFTFLEKHILGKIVNINCQNPDLDLQQFKDRRLK